MTSDMGFKLNKNEKVQEVTREGFGLRQELLGLTAQSTPAQVITGNYLGTDGTINTFDGLLDTPITKEGHGGDLVAVNTEASGLEYVDGTASYLKLDSTNGPITEQLSFNKGVTVNLLKGSTESDDLHVHGDTVDNLIQTDAGDNAIGFFNVTPIARVTTAVSAAAFVAGAGTAVNDASTFGGYTLKQIAKALTNYGLLT